ncbi:MAG: thioesterase family protein [Novosphingobium sp.]|nr:thioesterase family protein [Novosphingobium sp.]
MNAATDQKSPILSCFELEQTAPATFTGQSVGDERRPVVFGGQIMGQMIAAAALVEPGKQVKNLHTVFARAGTVKQPVEYTLDQFHSGRAFGSIEAIAAQGERMLSRGLLLMDAGEVDVIRHQVPELPVSGPEHHAATQGGEPGVEIRVVDNVDMMTTAVTGDPELNLWLRWSDVPDEPAMHQAALAWFTDPFLIGAAMRPHDGIGQEQAHESLSTGVITHTLTFHEAFHADEWLLISNRSQHAGGGRTYGDGHVFTEDGRLVASFVQTNMIRYFRDDGATRGRAEGAM